MRKKLTPIRLTTDQKFDIKLVLDTDCENLDALDADSAAYLIYQLKSGEIPRGKYWPERAGIAIALTRSICS